MRYAVAMFAVMSLAGSVVRGSGPIRPDLRVVADSVAIQGAWYALAFTQRDGKVARCDYVERWAFCRDRFTLDELKGQQPVEGTYKLDHQKHPPSLVIQLVGDRPVSFVHRLQCDVLYLTNSQGAILIFQRIKSPP